MALPTNNDREMCIDTAIRFVQGVDDPNKELLHSVFTGDTFFDPTGLSSVGRPYKSLSGREDIVPFLANHVGALDTLHLLTNFRVEVRDDHAMLTCHSLAQHHRPGEGSQPEKMGCLMGNRIKMGFNKDETGAWKISKIEIVNAWCQGDLAVMG